MDNMECMSASEQRLYYEILTRLAFGGTGTGKGESGTGRQENNNLAAAAGAAGGVRGKGAEEVPLEVSRLQGDLCMLTKKQLAHGAAPLRASGLSMLSSIIAATRFPLRTLHSILLFFTSFSHYAFFLVSYIPPEKITIAFPTISPLEKQKVLRILTHIRYRFDNKPDSNLLIT